MRTMKATLVRSSLACLLAVCALWRPAPSRVHAQVSELVVVIASSLGITDISSGTLRRVFSGYPTELSGRRLIPVNHPPNSVDRARFDRLVLGLTPDQVGRFWVDRRIRDEGQPPKIVPSAELAVRIAASLPGAITYVTTDLLNAKVRALTIDGKEQHDPRYALR